MLTLSGEPRLPGMEMRRGVVEMQWRESPACPTAIHTTAAPTANRTTRVRRHLGQTSPTTAPRMAPLRLPNRPESRRRAAVRRNHRLATTSILLAIPNSRRGANPIPMAVPRGDTTGRNRAERNGLSAPMLIREPPVNNRHIHRPNRSEGRPRNTNTKTLMIGKTSSTERGEPAPRCRRSARPACTCRNRSARRLPARIHAY